MSSTRVEPTASTRPTEPAAEHAAAAVAFDPRALPRVGARPGLIAYLRTLWGYRHFIAYDAHAQVRRGTRQDLLGSAWLILTPLFNGLTFYLVFGLLLQTSRGIPNFIGYLVIGVFLFQISSGSITTIARSLLKGKALIGAFTFPRAALPVGAAVRAAIADVPVVLAMLLIVVLTAPAEPITWRWIFLLPVLVLQWCFNLGIGLILARLIAWIPDVSRLLPFVVRAWMYTSGTFFSIDRYVTHPDIQAVMKANPVYCAMEIVRDGLLYGQLPSWHNWTILSAWAVGALVVGVVLIWQGEESYARD
ncbi:transport permease protein [Tersicoccus solisilvae]|uniref:Transport permease protein n=1 Tax=Tersicoccus solisilvae TaxID=1882339 RepID=A0ABQ1P3D0_9MICC|nr:ABC transporter permease [Tersicoccus solisilvae]GGC89989.1 transport permease protein [Tersicoccus solisilvae]